MGVAVGNLGMTKDELIGNIVLAIDYLVSFLKKCWQNVGSLTIKATMSPPRHLYQRAMANSGTDESGAGRRMSEQAQKLVYHFLRRFSMALE